MGNVLVAINLRVFTKTTFRENSLLLYLPAIRGGGGKDGGSKTYFRVSVQSSLQVISFRGIMLVL